MFPPLTLMSCEIWIFLEEEKKSQKKNNLGLPIIVIFMSCLHLISWKINLMSLFDIFILISIMDTAQKMKFSIKDFFSKCDQVRSLPWIWSHLLKKCLMENFIFCVVGWFNVLVSLCVGLYTNRAPFEQCGGHQRWRATSTGGIPSY